MEKKEIFNIIDEYMTTRGTNIAVSQVMEYDLRERMVRVEEAIKNINEQIRLLLDQMNKRFEQVDKRFEQVDKRFEQIDKRFEQIDKRLDRQHEDIMDLGRRMDRFMIWSFGSLLTATGLIIGSMKFFIG